MRAATLMSALTLVLSSLPSAGTESRVDDLLAQGQYCSATAEAQFRACAGETTDDFWTAIASCVNESDARDRKDCLADAKATREETNASCGEQHDARTALCGQVGEARYDPEFEAADFERDFAHLRVTNRYFPLGIGSEWEFHSATQVTRVRVTDATKLIDDVRCVVVRDEVFEGGVLIEGTNDWMAQAKDGNVWYCGEETAEFETFKGDRPKRPELTSIDGSFKAGREGDKPGILFFASPAPGQVYREEFSLGNAEDAAEVLAVDYSYGKDAALDEMVPPRLARMLCARDCVVTKNVSSLEPGVIERKYYAPGIGVFLEIEPEAGEVVQLVKCNVDPRCASLPH